MSVFTSINCTSGSRLVREQVQHAIETGVVASDSPLPPERELDEEKVAHSPVA